MHPEHYTDLDNFGTVQSNLRNSAKGSNDAYDVTDSLTLNLVAGSPWGEKNSSKNFWYLVNPWNVDERKGVEIASGNCLQTASNSEVGYSQVRRHENA